MVRPHAHVPDYRDNQVHEQALPKVALKSFRAEKARSWQYAVLRTDLSGRKKSRSQTHELPKHATKRAHAKIQANYFSLLGKSQPARSLAARVQTPESVVQIHETALAPTPQIL